MVDDAEEQTPLLRVARIEVEGLFGLYDHRIELKLDERVTILHGPNGVGKTMLLRMVDLVLDGRWVRLRRLPFRAFEITFTDDSRLRVVRTIAHSAGAKPEVDILLKRSDAVPMRHSFEWPLFDELHDQVEDTAPDHEGALSLSLFPKKPTEPEWLTGFRGYVDTHLISVERLVPTEPRKDLTLSQRTIIQYAGDLATRIAQVLADYGRRAQVLDQSFPQRLLEAPSIDVETSALIAQMEMISQKRTELTQIGLLDESSQAPFRLDSLDQLPAAQRSVMALYARDTGEKLSVFDDLADRIKLLLDIVNAKLRHKRVRVDRKEGLVVEPRGYSGPSIALDALSSGEQHEIVLHYDLLFRIRPNTLVLIDEPELSLHVGWQKRFLPDLLRIVAVAGIDVLVATHSPFIIGERRDLMVGLSDELP